MTAPADAVPGEPAGAAVFLLNHQQDDFGDAIRALRDRGMEVHETRSLADSHRLLARLRPDVVVLDPLVPSTGSVELDLVSGLQAADPVPVVFVVDDLGTIGRARSIDLPVADFVLRPARPDELAARVQLALAQRRRLTELLRRTRELEGQVSVDFKTGLMSERQFRQVLQREHKRAQRHQSHLSLLLLDVDDFKSVNDSTEYAFGDLVLRHVADALQRNTRDIDYAARFGGDEFAVLLPQTTPANAVQTAIRIRKMVAEIELSNERYTSRVTSSIGIDTYDGRTSLTPEELVRRANKALHEAKRRGKNQVWLHTEKGLDAEAS